MLPSPHLHILYPLLYAVQTLSILQDWFPPDLFWESFWGFLVAGDAFEPLGLSPTVAAPSRLFSTEAWLS